MKYFLNLENKDPILLLSVIALIGVIVIMGIILISTLVIAIVISSFIVYFVITAIQSRKNKQSVKQTKLHISPLLTLFISLPIALSVVLYYEGHGIVELLLQLIVLYSYTILVILNIVFTPIILISISKKKFNNYQTISTSFSLTVIIPAYNEEKSIERTIKSVQNSIYTKKEIIVVNNASTDNTVKILQKFQDNIRILNEPKKGKSNAINKGIRYATGEIIVILDADTIILKNTLTNIVQPFKKNRITAVTGEVLVLNKENFISKMQVIDYAVGMNLARGTLGLYEIVPIVSGAFGAFRKSRILEKNNPIFSTDTMTEDFDVTITLLRHGHKTEFVKDALAYTEVPERFMDLVHQRYRWFRGFLQVYRKHKDYFFNTTTTQHHNISFFLLLNSNMIFPTMIMVNLLAIIPTILVGNAPLFGILILLNLTNITLLSIFGLRLSTEKLGYVKYSFATMLFMWIGVYVYVKSIIDEIIQKDHVWRTISRRG